MRIPRATPGQSRAFPVLALSQLLQGLRQSRRPVCALELPLALFVFTALSMLASHQTAVAAAVLMLPAYWLWITSEHLRLVPQSAAIVTLRPDAPAGAAVLALALGAVPMALMPLIPVYLATVSPFWPPVDALLIGIAVSVALGIGLSMVLPGDTNVRRRNLVIVGMTFLGVLHQLPLPGGLASLLSITPVPMLNALLTAQTPLSTHAHADPMGLLLWICLPLLHHAFRSHLGHSR